MLKTLIRIGCVLSLASLPVSEPHAQVQRRSDLWVTIGISDPLFQEGWTKNLNLHFALVNDSPRTIDPRIEASKIVINGKELADSARVFGNGPRSLTWNALPAGDSLRFGYALGEYFKDPGVYTVSWRGPGFETLPIVFRVLPARKLP